MPLWLADVVVMIALLVTTELMYRAGRSTRMARDEATRSQISTLQASTLGMLALILGFTLSMADSRFGTRRQIVRAEAAAVGTTYLRADFLPEPERSQSRELLRSYVDARRAYFRASPDEAPATTARAQALHVQLWTHTATAATAHPDWDVLGTYIESLNEMIDLEAARDLTIEGRLPPAIRGLLFLVALVAVGVTGYATGFARVRSPLSLYVTPILVALAGAVIADLDRTRAGIISTGDRPMERLQRSMVDERAALGTPSELPGPR